VSFVTNDLVVAIDRNAVNRIGDEGAKSLAVLLEKNKTLTSIFLCGKLGGILSKNE
jgi:hypothetical protein